MTISFWTNVISTFGTLFISFFIFGKAVNHKPSGIHRAFSILWCLLWALLFSCLPMWTPLLIIRVSFCAASIAMVWKMSKFKFDVAISTFLLSFGASNCLFYIAVVLIGMFFAPFLGARLADDALIDFSNPIYILAYSLVAALQFVIAYLFFKIPRFKRGFRFLFGRYAVAAAMMVAGIVLTIVSVIVTQRENAGAQDIIFPLAISATIIGVGIVIWIRRGIRAMQKKWAKQDNEALYQKKIAELERELQLQKDVNENLRSANHSIRHRLAAWERNMAGYLESEAANELGIALSDIRKLSADYEADVSRVKQDAVLPSTNVKVIDDMFELFAERFSAADILFKLKVTGSIVYMTENAIKQDKLETMIGDHLHDALIAVNASESSTRSIMAAIGEVGDCYEFTVFDSGIPFEVDTLARLGAERVTTHAGTGGSGVGFMKTFETMRECGASLIIRENRGGVFSKSVTIRFDGENRYIIKTYRPGDFPESGRYTVVSRK